MKLSEQLKRARTDRPDEWIMDRYVERAKEMEDALQWFLTPDRPIGSNSELIHEFRCKAENILNS